MVGEAGSIGFSPKSMEDDHDRYQTDEDMGDDGAKCGNGFERMPQHPASRHKKRRWLNYKC